MYKIFFKDFPLYDPRREALQIRDPDVHLAVGEAGEISFTIDSDHPHAGELTRMNGVARLTADDITIFRGRIRKDTKEFNLSRRIEIEGLLACLNDSVIPPFNFPDDFLDDEAYQAAAESGNVIKFFLQWLLDQHNSQVGPAQQIQLGDVTMTDPNNYITRSSSDFLSTMEIVKKKLVDLLGGYLLPDYTDEITRLHYYDDLPLTNVQEVEFGKNLLDLSSDLDAADVYTAILPVGKDGLTIAALPDGEISPGIIKEGLVIYSEEAETTAGGRITRPVKWDDVTLAENLQTKATTELTTSGVKHIQTISVKAIDLGGEDEIPRFRVGRYVRFKSAPHGFTSAYPLMELDPDIFNPANTSITLNATIKASSDISHDQKNDLEEGQEQLRDIVNQQKDRIDILAETTQTQITEVVQTCESLILSALESYVKTGDYETFKQTVESQLTILSDEISLKFTEVTEQIVDVNGDLQATVETLSKYFEFGLDGLVIKTGENTMQLVLDNDLISFQKDGKTFGWWDGVDFHTGNIVIGVEERAQFGAFAFVPRENGSLSFLKAGD